MAAGLRHAARRAQNGSQELVVAAIDLGSDYHWQLAVGIPVGMKATKLLLAMARIVEGAAPAYHHSSLAPCDS